VRKLAFSNEAVADLREITRHSDRAWGVGKRVQYVGSLRAAVLRLRTQPAVGEVQPGFVPEVRRIRQGRHLIFYEVSDAHIRVVRILHDRMDIPAHLQR
jgi:toxin ParE1/3/4